MTAQVKTSLSGIKPTGVPHLGNILGMIEPAINLQETHNTLYFIADLHALTSVRDAQALKDDTHTLAATFLALGFDPHRGALYRQSDVPEITELTWLLSCTVSIGDLFRAHAFKAAKDAGTEGQLNLGTFSYPVLMAADILAYDSDIVPVGKDQLQHLEMARAIAKRFNHHFGETFKEPKEFMQESVAIVPGIDGRKMSKSYANGIEPLLNEKTVKKQVMSIVTDSKGLEDPKDPNTCHIFALYKLFSNSEEQRILSEKYRGGNFGYGHAKLELLEKIEQRFSESRKKYESVLKNRADLDEILHQGALKAREKASKVLARAQKACGLQ
jgi:tryptophanyl-tRNA synthetase